MIINTKQFHFAFIFSVVTSFLTFQAIAQESPAERFQELTGTWIVSETSFIDPPQGTMEVNPAADGKAIYSTFKHGNNDTYYEANALWGYPESGKQVRVFEVNNFDVAVTHIGYFDKNGTLITELRDAETNNLIQYREMRWDKQTYEMKAQFWKEGKKINHHMVLKRQPYSKHESSVVNPQPEKLSKINLQKEEIQIRRLWKDASECICTGNWEGYKNCWKQNSEFQVIHPFQGEWLNGWIQVREKYKKLLQSGGRFTSLKDDLTLDISKSGDMAWGTMDIIFQIGEDKNNTVHVWETAAFEKVNDEWKFVMEMACSPKKQ